MSYRPHQIEKSDAALELLRKNKMVAIFGEPRTGKTRTSIRTAIEYGARSVLVLTRKNAFPGWQKELADVPLEGVSFHVTNYEQVHKLQLRYDLLILDESHNLGTRGRATKRVRAIRKLCYRLPLIALSGTPTIETPTSIYHQWHVTRYSPFNKYRDFYQWFRDWGIPEVNYFQGRRVNSYERAKPELPPYIERFVVRMTQEEAGITQRSKDQVHTVKLGTETRRMIDELLEKGVTRTQRGKKIVVESDMAARGAVHQIETGALLQRKKKLDPETDKVRVTEKMYDLANTEVVDYLMETFGDHEGVAYFCHYRSTRRKLEKHFKRAQLFSSIAHAEGVDMSHVDDMVVVNTGYSGAKGAQLRERVVNMNATTERRVHYIVCEGGISPDVYEAVRNKVDYNLQSFRARRRKARG